MKKKMQTVGVEFTKPAKSISHRRHYFSIDKTGERGRSKRFIVHPMKKKVEQNSRCHQTGTGVSLEGTSCNAKLPDKTWQETGKLRGRAAGAENA